MYKVVRLRKTKDRYLDSIYIPRTISISISGFICSKALSPVTEPVHREIFPIVVLRRSFSECEHICKLELELHTSQRGFSMALKKWRRLPGHIMIGPSAVPPLNQDRHGEFHAVRFRKSSRCCLKSSTAACFGMKDLISSVCILMIAFSM